MEGYTCTGKGVIALCGSRAKHHPAAQYDGAAHTGQPGHGSQAQLLQNAANMGFDSLERDIELRGNFLVAHAMGHQLQNLNLALG
jgi:hypothetical protein